MNRRSLWLTPILAFCMLFAIFDRPALAQYAPGAGQPVSTPLAGVSDDEVTAAVAGGTTIPMWRYTTTSSRDGQTYSGMMVGASPFSNPDSTTVIATQKDRSWLTCRPIGS